MIKNAAGLVVLGAALVACGGGGDGPGPAAPVASNPGTGTPSGSSGTTTPTTPTPPPPPPPEVKVLSGAIARYAAQNTGVDFAVQIKPNNFTPTGTLVVNASDPSNVIGTQVGVTTNTDGSYTLALSSKANAAAGHYAGNVTLKLCADQDCATPQAVPSVTVPYDLTVLASTTAWPGDHLTALAAWTDAPEWSTFQGNAAHTAYVPVTINPDQMQLRWKSAAINSNTSSSYYGYDNSATLTVANGVFYGAGSNMLKARKEYDGSVVWSYDFSGLSSPMVYPPAVANGTVYMAAGQSPIYLFAFDAATGAVRFKAPLAYPWNATQAPTPVDDAIYANSGYNALYAFKPTGELLFNKSLTYSSSSTGSPAVDANSVYVYDGALHILDRKTGMITSEIRNGTAPTYYGYGQSGAPVLGANGSVFVADFGSAQQNSSTSGNQLLKFNATKGYIDWRVAGNYPLTPAYANGVVYASNYSPYRVEARAEADGALLWSWTPNQAGETLWNAEPIITKNLLFVSTNLATYAIDISTHKAVWSYPAAGRLALSRSGILYIQNVEAVVAVNLK